eukprot:CCRYP_013737-RA/>CCRYP_013737-RA protein AED:0.42 eAED:0.29 QI:0/0/0/0.75/0/0.25/4/0/546
MLTRHDNPSRSFPCPPLCTTAQPLDDAILPAHLPLSTDTPALNTPQTAEKQPRCAPHATTLSRTSPSRLHTPITRHQTLRLTRMENESTALAAAQIHRRLTISSANEFGFGKGRRGRIKVPNYSIHPQVRHSPGPPKDATYGRFACTARPEKRSPSHSPRSAAHRIITGRSHPTAEMLTAKLLSTAISTPVYDHGHFQLLPHDLPRPEYLRLKLSDIPTEIIRNTASTSLGGWDHLCSCSNVCRSLPQAGLLANELLEKRLNAHGYHQSKLVPACGNTSGDPSNSPWWWMILSTIIHYRLEGSRYIGITLDWDYDGAGVHLSMPGYVKRLSANSNTHTTGATCTLHRLPINYGARKCLKHPQQPHPRPKGQKFIQQVCGKFLFLGRAVDPTLLCPISAIASQSSKPTVDTPADKTTLGLHRHPRQSSAHLQRQRHGPRHPQRRQLSQATRGAQEQGFFLSSNAEIPPNGAVLNIAHIIKHVMASATAELAALYIMARKAVFIRIILEELGHTQPHPGSKQTTPPLKASSNGKIQPKRTKAMDMRFH